MEINKFITKIKKYSLISFILPLITINLCLILFKVLGGIDTYPTLSWNDKEFEYSFNNYISIDKSSRSFTDCPKYVNQKIYILDDGKIVTEERAYELEKEHKNLYLKTLYEKNKIKSIKFIPKKTIDDRCLKNYKFSYFLLNKLNFLEQILINAKKNNSSGFAKVKNPYLYGEVSISRTARYYPATLIFKPLIILSALFLLVYWKNNLNLFKGFESKNIIHKFSKTFYYLGLLSCLFLILHASFLGLDFDSKLFKSIRRIIIIAFILFEVSAQVVLTMNLYKFKENIKNYIFPVIIKIKIIFVSIILFVTVLVFLLLVFGDLSSYMKHMLEWNYFSILLIYYLFSRLLWRSK